MAVQQIIAKAFQVTTGVVCEKGISPSADLTPVYVGKFCYLGKVVLDEYDLMDQKILGLAALLITGVVAREKGWNAFRWVPEFILPVARDKIIGFLENHFRNSTDIDTGWKSEKDRHAFYLTSAITLGIFQSLEVCLVRSRNPKVLLRSHIPLELFMVGYSAFADWYHPTIEKKIENYSKDYAYDIRVISSIGFYLLVYGVAAKAIEKGMGAPILANRKVTLISSAVCLMAHLLIFSPNSPFNKAEG